MADDYTTEVEIQGKHDGSLTTIAVDADGQLYALMVGRDGAIMAIDEDGNTRSIMYGSYNGALTPISLDSGGRILAQLIGMYGSVPVPVACDSGGRLTVAAFDQTNISPDSSEAQTLDTPLVSIVSNLNRIRHWIVTLSGETWGTVTTSTATLWAKFHVTTGHAHSGAANDGAIVSYNTLSDKPTVDFTPYYKCDGTKALTAGIPFPATQVPSADVNTLDDYEEGTFTPHLLFDDAETGVTYAGRAGVYTKIGNIVYISGYAALSSKGGNTAYARVSGLPFTITAGAGASGGCIIGLLAVGFADQWLGQWLALNTKIDLYQTTNAGSSSRILGTTFSDTSTVFFGGWYTVN